MEKQLATVESGTSTSITNTEDADRRLIEATTGRLCPSDDVKTTTFSAQQRSTYCGFVRRQLQPFIQGAAPLAARAGGRGQRDDVDALVDSFCKMACQLRTERRITIDVAVSNLPARGGEAADQSNVLARHEAFAMVGLATMLYLAIAPTLSDQFQISTPTCSMSGQNGMARVSLNRSSRPLGQLIRGFGTLLPSRGGAQSSRGGPETFDVGSINARVLCGIGGIFIEWVTAVGCHLHFDEQRTTLYLFALPSFCALHSAETAALFPIYRQYHEDYERPPGFDADAYFGEIERSFSFLFANARRARAQYRDSERAKAIRVVGGAGDPYLDELCGLSGRIRSGSAGRKLFSKSTDFPILSERISALQNYMRAKKPRNLKELFRDRRDTMSWYNYWPAILLALLAFIMTFISTITGIVQMVYSIKAYNAQQAEG
ncbi:hypothetical protein B0T25DRAFT_563903 [Lasiosphaeria hispida]|uniref:Uncharacterized protein n=1 Tax=Lasiosphaeria hispida TaxID=260671 RepID=A0AAJ0MH69_9PEZI|nr:hypothetical protein B0T25DRAFT_563903 [Lasiosphaeria hispida]